MVATFRQRVAIGHAGQAQLRVQLTGFGFQVFHIGQEHVLPDDIITALRYARDPMARAVKHAPDLLAWRADFGLVYWDAMVNTTAGTPNFAIEQTKLEELLARCAKGERVALAWKDTDGSWWAQWATSLATVAAPSRHTAAGSRAPFVLVRKHCTLELSRFIQEGIQNNAHRTD